MCCNKCNKEKKIVNKKFNLCLDCNNERLHGNKYGKQYSNTILPKKTSKKSLFSKTITPRKTTKQKITDDEAFYKRCFDNSNHKCEECGKQLPTDFKIDGKVIAKWRYSHIIAKSIAPLLRHVLKNINHLCMECHTKWDHGDKESMKIYSKNKKIFPGRL